MVSHTDVEVPYLLLRYLKARLSKGNLGFSRAMLFHLSYQGRSAVADSSLRHYSQDYS